MMVGDRQPAQPDRFFMSTGAAALSALDQWANDRQQPAKRASGAGPNAWPASVKAGTIRSLVAWMTVACALVYAVSSVVTELVEPPASLAGVTVVDARRAGLLMDAGAALIDTRAAADYDRGHIAGALNVPYENASANEVPFDHTKDSFDLSKLPADKTVPVVLYCNARPCWSSYKASKVAAAVGHGNVNWLRGGLAEWTSAGHERATRDPHSNNAFSTTKGN